MGAMWYTVITVNVWIKLCNKKAKCAYCPEPIVKGDYMVVTQTIRSLKSSTKKWVIRKRYHTQCWIAQGIQNVSKREYIERRGRKPLNLSPEDMETRRHILMRRAAVVQRIRNEVSKPAEERNIDRIIHYGGQLSGLKDEIEKVGGAPKSWLE